MKNVSLLFLLFISAAGFSQTDNSLVKFINPKSLSIPRGYSHMAEIDLGNCKMIIISGQIAIDNTGKLVGKNNLTEQTEQIFTNLKNIMTESGGTIDNIIKIGIYMLDITLVQTMRDVRDKYINKEKPPTSTLVQVSKLVGNDFLIEIEATAIIPKKIEK